MIGIQSQLSICSSFEIYHHYSLLQFYENSTLSLILSCYALLLTVYGQCPIYLLFIWLCAWLNIINGMSKYLKTYIVTPIWIQFSNKVSRLEMTSKETLPLRRMLFLCSAIEVSPVK